MPSNGLLLDRTKYLIQISHTVNTFVITRASQLNEENP